MNLHIQSPNVTSGDRFATTNAGYTTAVKFHSKEQYLKSLDQEKEHRLKMRGLMLGQSFELGFDEKGNCPSNEEMRAQGKPMFEQATIYNTKDQEENKSLVER